MDECGKCYKFERCFERRGICTEYRSTEAIRQEIAAVMQSCKASKAESSKAKAPEKGRVDGRGEDKN